MAMQWWEGIKFSSHGLKAVSQTYKESQAVSAQQDEFSPRCEVAQAAFSRMSFSHTSDLYSTGQLHRPFIWNVVESAPARLLPDSLSSFFRLDLPSSISIMPNVSYGCVPVSDEKVEAIAFYFSFSSI